MSEEKLTKPELTAAIETDRARLEDALARFADTQKMEPLLENGWSIKDLMAHVATWERVGFDIVQAARDGEPLKDYVSKVFESIDNFNAQTYEKNKDKSLRDIESEFKAAYKDFTALIEPLDDAFIASNLPFEGVENLSVQVIITANTYHHYREHAEECEKLSGKVSSD
jgi:hypothetical protein